jgi:hypothetical protein
LGERAALRVEQADYAGEAGTPEQYLIESVADPNAYLVPGFTANVMPINFADRITLQQMADLMAYMLSFR